MGQARVGEVEGRGGWQVAAWDWLEGRERVRWQPGVGPAEVAGGWVDRTGVRKDLGWGLSWTDFIPGVVVRVESARSTAPLKIIKYFIYFKQGFCKPIADKTK